MNLDIDLYKGLKYRGLFAFATSNARTESIATERSYYIADIRGYDLGFFPPLSREEEKSKLPYGENCLMATLMAIRFWYRNGWNTSVFLIINMFIRGLFIQEITMKEYKGHSAIVYGYDNEGGDRVTWPNLVTIRFGNWWGEMRRP